MDISGYFFINIKLQRINMNLRIKTLPLNEPVTLAFLKAHLRVVDEAEEPYLTHLLKTARAQIELMCNRVLITQSWSLELHNPGDSIRLPLAPVQKINTIFLYNSKGDKISMGLQKIQIENAQDNAILKVVNPLFGKVKINFVVGYGDDENAVPAPLKHAILMLAGHFYEHRGDQAAIIPESIKTLVEPYMYRRHSL